VPEPDDRLRDALERAARPPGADGVLDAVVVRKRRRRQVRRAQLGAVPVLALALIAGLLTAGGDDDGRTGVAAGPSAGGRTTTTALASSTSAAPSSMAASAGGATATTRPRATTTTSQDPSGVRGGIAFVDHGHLYVMEPDGSGRIELPVGREEGPFVGDPDWNRDGTRIVFVTLSKYGGDMRSVRRDGSDVQTIPNVTGLLRTPRVSPDDRKIIYVQTDMYGSNGSLYLMNTDGSGGRRLSPDPIETSDLGPAWAPDSSRIVFSTRPYSQQGPTTLAVLNLQTGKRTPLPLPAGVENATDPSWSPDGRSIAFTARSHDWRTSDVYVMNADGSDPVRLTTTGVDAMPDWSPGGGWLVFARDGDVWTMHADGSAPTRIADVDVAIYAPSWR
jgi:TolB protein